MDNEHGIIGEHGTVGQHRTVGHARQHSNHHGRWGNGTIAVTMDRLNTEWETLARDRASRPTVAGWAIGCPGLQGSDTLDAVLTAIGERPDEVLGRLLAADADGCPLAGRVVLQAMLPKLIVMSRRDHRADFTDYLSQLWLRIRTYPLARRPDRIAANLALDTLKAVKSEQGTAALAATDEVLERLQQDAARRADPPDELAARRVLRAAGELGLVDDLTRAVLVSVYADGLTGRAAAERHQISHDLIRWRCSKGVRALSAHRAELLAAA